MNLAICLYCFFYEWQTEMAKILNGILLFAAAATVGGGVSNVSDCTVYNVFSWH